MLDNLEYLDLVRRLHSVPDALVAAVKELDEIKSLFADLVLVCTNVLEQFKCRDFSCCLEVSMQSEDMGRIHLHAFIERHCREDKRWWSWDQMDSMLMVREVSVSHGNVCLAKTRGRNRERALTEGHYYCQALKIGHVCHHSTKPIFEKIFPDSRMVTTLWMHRKMNSENAKAEVLLTRDKVPAVLSILASTMSLEYAATMEKDAILAEMNWKRRPFKVPSADELIWLRQFALTASKPYLHQARAKEFVSAHDIGPAALLRRFKFLIYDGPSRLGKTELAISWFGALHTLVVNAQDTTSPNLRPMMTGKFEAIVFDEGKWDLCGCNKLIFQAGSRPVELSQSQCNDRCYQVLLFRVPMIICSNNFWKGCCDKELKEWIEQNSFYVKITDCVFT